MRIFILTLFYMIFALKAHAFDTIAQNAYVIDVSTGSVMLDKESQVSKPPASTSKLMTIALLFKAIEEGRISLDTEFDVSEKAWAMGGSKMFVEINSKVSVDDLIHGIVIQSGNDACVVVAEGLAGTEDNFAIEMNAHAVELGLTDSTFGNSSGWPHPNQRMSAKDLATLAYHLYQKYPQYWHYFAKPEFTYNNISQKNRNPLLGIVAGADGLKTGHTNEAGYGLVGSVARDNRRVIIVLLGMNSEAERAAEAERVATWALSEFKSVTQFKSGEKIVSAKTWQADTPEIPLTTAEDFTALLPIDGSSPISIKAVYDEPISAPLAKGTEVGYLEVSGTNAPAYKIPLLTGEDLNKGSFGKRFMEVIANGITSNLPTQNESTQ